MHAPLLVLFCATTNEPLQPRELNETAQRPSTASSLLAPPDVQDCEAKCNDNYSYTFVRPARLLQPLRQCSPLPSHGAGSGVLGRM